MSDGTITWVGEGLWKADDICFEWLDEKKFPLDCKIYGNVIASCKTNRDYPGLKCPTGAKQDIINNLLEDISKIQSVNKENEFLLQTITNEKKIN